MSSIRTMEHNQKLILGQSRPSLLSDAGECIPSITLNVLFQRLKVKKF